MKMFIRVCIAVIFVAVAGLCYAADGKSDAGCVYRLTLSDDSKLWLEGDSTMHAFESRATVQMVDSKVVFQSPPTNVSSLDILKGQAEAPKLSRMVLTIPIKDMKSKTVGLAGHMNEALKYKEHPAIIFELGSYKVEPVEAQTNQFNVSVEGKVSLAGQTNNITVAMPAVLAGSAVNVKGKKDLLMSDFGVAVPSLFFGTLKVADKIVVQWDWNITLTKED